MVKKNIEKPVAFIPARTGSVRVKNKNFKLLNGVPLIVYTFYNAIKSNIFSEIIVSTDVPNIVRKIIDNFKKEDDKKLITIHNRPVEISQNNSNDCEWIANIFNTIGWEKYNHYIILRPTNIFRSEKIIIKAWKEYQINCIKSKISLKSVSEVKERPEKMWFKRVEKSKLLLPYYAAGVKNGVPTYEQQSFNFNKLYCQNGCIDICPTSIIKKHNNRYIGDVIYPFYTQFLEGFDINTETDFSISEIIIQHSLYQS